MEDQFLKVAKQAALEAGEIISGYFGKEHTYNFKNNDKSDYATQADLESEEAIVKILSKNFPDHNIIAEEKAKIQKGSEYTWFIDPLDGTISFASGIFYFAVSIGLLKGNKPIVGVIYHIFTKELYSAAAGKGAYINDKKIQVNKREDFNSSVLAMDCGHKNKRAAKIDSYILPMIKNAGYIYSLGSTSMCMALVSKGVFDGMAAQAFPWDFAAGVVIIKEAGGVVSNFQGGQLDWSKDRLNVIASNGLIHDEIVEILSSSLRGTK